MSTELAEDDRAELAVLYGEWQSAVASAATLLKELQPGQAPRGYRLTMIELAEARAAKVVHRYRALSGR